LKRGSDQPADRAGDPELPKGGPMNVSPESSEPEPGCDEVRDCNHSNGLRGRHRQHEERREQAADAEAGNRRDGTSQNRSSSDQPK
jgi:hypothetical protein